MAVYQSLSLTLGEQSVESNQSQVRILWESTQSGSSYNLVEREAYFWISINGQPETRHSITYSLPKDSVQTLLDATLTVSHNEKGEAEIRVRTWMDTHISAGVVELSETLVPDPIPRPSTVRATDAYIGGFSRLAVTKRSSRFTHSIAWQFGCKRGFISPEGQAVEQELVFAADSVDFQIPDHFYEEILDRKADTCCLTIRTYDGEQPMTETCQGAFTVTADERLCSPVVIGSVRDIRQETVALTGDDQVMIRYASQAECAIEAYGRMGALIAEKRINDQLVSADSGVIADYELEHLRLTAKDSRGYTAVLILQPKVIPYVKLSCNAVARRDSAASEQATLEIFGDYYAGSFGQEENSLSVSYQIDGAEPVTVEPVLTEDQQYRVQIHLTDMDYSRLYGITVMAADRLCRVEMRTVLKKGVPVFDWGENDFAFHVPVLLDQPLGIAYGGTGASVPSEIWKNLGMTFPMEPGREYETWHRWQGKPIYTALVEFGDLPNNAEDFRYHLLPAAGIVAVLGSLSDGRSLPWGGTHSQRADVYCDREKVYLDTNGDFSGLSAAVQIYYFKNQEV